MLATAYMPPAAFWVAARRMVTQAEQGCDGGRPVLRLCRDEYYRKQTYRNRAVILNAQGEQRLSVPVSCPRGLYTKVEDVRVCYDKDWRRDHWRSLCTAYNNSPYFLYYQDELEAVLMQTRYERLWDLNLRLIAFFIKAFGLDWAVEAASRREAQGAVVAFSDKAPALWQTFAPAVSPEAYQNTFMQAVPCPARLSACDLLFNYGPQAGRLFA
ncbi:MAG: WbqC family protein [Bacteroidales bacterium]|nr:WbqC family protein [Bacteroidales bacterium]